MPGAPLLKLDSQANELEDTLVWKLEGLNPNKLSTVGIQHITWPGRNGIILDRIVITAIVGTDHR